MLSIRSIRWRTLAEGALAIIALCALYIPRMQELIYSNAGWLYFAWQVRKPGGKRIARLAHPLA